MGADHLAEIRPAVREFLSAIAESVDDDWCLTVAVGATGRWVQVTRSALNMDYPFTDGPKLRLATVLSRNDARLEEWEAGKFATFGVTASEIVNLPNLLDALVSEVLGVDESVGLDVQVALL